MTLNIFFATADERKSFLNFDCNINNEAIKDKKVIIVENNYIKTVKLKTVYKHIPGYWAEITTQNNIEGNEFNNSIIGMFGANKINENVFFPRNNMSIKELNRAWIKKYNILKNRLSDDMWKIFFQEIKYHYEYNSVEVAYSGVMLIFKYNPFFLKKYKRYYILEDLAYYFEELGNVGKAIKCLKIQSVLCPESMDPYLNMSSFYIINGMETEAISICEKGLAKSPQNQYLMSNLIIAASNMGSFEYAMDYLKKVLFDEPNNPYYWKLLGDIFYELDNTDDALDCFLKSYEKGKKEKVDDLQSDVCSSIATCYYDKENYKEAVKFYRRVLNYTPFDSFALLSLSQIYYNQLSEMKSALKYTKILTEKMPENGYGQFQLGLIYLELGNFEKSKWHLYRARQIMPHFGPVQDAINSIKKIK